MINPNYILISDLDGTLIDSRKDLTTATNLVRKHYGLSPLSVDTVTSYIGNGAKKLVERALKNEHYPDIEEAVALLKKFYSENMFNETTLYPGVKEGLEILHRNGWILVLLTNKPEKPAYKLLEYFDISKFFSMIVGGDSGFPLKPDPQAVNIIIKKFSGRTRTTWILGDNYTDLECGRKAGILRCYAAYGFGNPKKEQWDLKITSFPEFLYRQVCTAP